MSISKIIDAIVETAHDLNDAGVMDTITLREFDAMTLPPVKKYSAAQIKRLRVKIK